jgi:beta-phosphoglucomutase-like phosphatase (HAD superfamily)
MSMSPNLLPTPNDDDSSSRADASEGRSKRRRRGARQKSQSQEPIPGANDCLRLLHRLGGMVALGLITPSQAGVLRGIYQTILQHHQRRESAPQQAFGGAEFMDKLRADPDLVNLLAPFLTNDQLNELLGEGGPDESV